MSIYSKKLKSVTELEREKKRLSKKLSALEQEDMFSVDMLAGAFKGRFGGGLLTSLVGMLPISDLVKEVVSNGASKLTKKEEIAKPKTRPGGSTDENSIPPKVNKLKANVRKVLLEVLFGYAKWKAIELSYKAIKHLVRNSKADKSPSATWRK